MGAVFAGRFDRTAKDLLERLVFEKGNNNWVDLLPTITKQYNKSLHSSTKLTPIQPSLKKNEGFVYKNFSDKRQKLNPKFQVNNLIRTTDLEKTFSKGDMTIWSYKFYKNTEVVKNTKPSCHPGNLPERYNESLLEKTELTLKENEDVIKKLNIT